jgi:cold shock CspA family protein
VLDKENRLCARNVKILPKGSVVFEEVVMANLEGIVMNPPRARRGQGQEAIGGWIRLVQTSRHEFQGSSFFRELGQTDSEGKFEFAQRDIVGDRALSAGDRVRFDVFEEKNSKRRGATRVDLIEASSAAAEAIYYGTLRADVIYDTTQPPQKRGLIRMDGERKDISFLTSGKLEPPTPSYSSNNREQPQRLLKGDRLSFMLATDAKNQSYATNLKLVERTNIARKQGFIRKLIEDKNFGFISTLQRNDMLFFHFSELEEAKAGVASNAASVSASVSKPKVVVTVDTEVEFNEVITEKGCSAVRIAVLPKGTLKTMEVLPTVFEGIVAVPLNHSGGKIKYDSPNDSKDAKNATISREIRFTADNLAGSAATRPMLCAGDVVSFQVMMRYNFPEKRSVTNVTLLRKDPERRHKGVVVAFRETAGLIRCEKRAKLLQFRTSRMQFEADKVKVGTFLEFNISSEDHHEEAVSIDRLHVPVVLERFSEEKFIGVVVKSVKAKPAREITLAGRESTLGKILICRARSTDLSHQHPGSLGPAVNSQGFDQKDLHPGSLFGNETLMFDRSDLVSGTSLKIGDTVGFRIAQHVNFPQVKRAAYVVMLARRGIIVSVPLKEPVSVKPVPTSGTITTSEEKVQSQLVIRTLPVPAAPGLPATLEEDFTFQSVSLSPAFASLRAGDLVSFSEAISRPSGRMALNISLLEKSPESESDLSDDDTSETSNPIAKPPLQVSALVRSGNYLCVLPLCCYLPFFS